MDILPLLNFLVKKIPVMQKNNALTGGALIAALAIAIHFVMPLEGRKLTAYPDVNGIPTICNGITKDVELGQTKTNAECDELLKSELLKRLAFIDKEVKVPLSAYQRAGLASFAYNVGDNNFAHSNVVKWINSGDTARGCNDLLNWVYVGGKDCRVPSNNCGGIPKRREIERKLCLKVSA